MPERKKRTPGRKRTQGQAAPAEHGRAEQGRPHEPVQHLIHGRLVVYGSGSCGNTRHTREHLDQIGLEYEYVDIDRRKHAQDWVLQENQGQKRTPMIAVGDQVLSMPSDEQLDRAMQEQGILPS